MQAKRSKWVDLLVLAVFSLSLLLIYRQLRQYRFSDIIDSFLLIAPSRLAFSVLFTLLNYLIVTVYDVLAFRHFGVSLPLKKVLLAAFIGDAASKAMSPVTRCSRAARSATGSMRGRISRWRRWAR